MGLEQIINISISRQTAAVAQAGFGVPLIIGTNGSGFGTSERVRTYTSLAGVAADFANTTDEYKAAAAIFAQAITPPMVKIAHKKAGDATWQAALDALCLVDSDWYGLIATTRTVADVQAIAAWAETHRVIFATASNVAGVKDPASTTDIAYVLNASGYARTFVLYSAGVANFPEAAWLGRCLPLDPGSETWMFKTLAGVTADGLTATEENAILDKNANTYQALGGVSVTRKGTMAVGEFIDTIRGIDWLEARLQERIYGTLTRVKKVPYTDAGVAIIEADVRAQLLEGVRVGLLAEGSLAVEVPKVAAVAANDKAIRSLPGVKFSARLAGAIHAVTLTGAVTL